MSDTTQQPCSAGSTKENWAQTYSCKMKLCFKSEFGFVQPCCRALKYKKSKKKLSCCTIGNKRVAQLYSRLHKRLFHITSESESSIMGSNHLFIQKFVESWNSLWVYGTKLVSILLSTDNIGFEDWNKCNKRSGNFVLIFTGNWTER